MSQNVISGYGRNQLEWYQNHPCVCVFISSFSFDVPGGPHAGAYDSLQPGKCAHCSHDGPIEPNACHDCHTNMTGPHAEAGVLVNTCSSAHQTSCHSTVRCHWLHGSNEGGAQKPMQRHVVAMRCVLGKSWMDEKINASSVKFPKMIKLHSVHSICCRDGGLHCILRRWVLRPIFTLKSKTHHFSNDFLCAYLFGSYSQVLVDYPLAVLVGCAALLLGCSLAGLFIGPLPDFSDPLLVGHKQSCAHYRCSTFASSITPLFPLLGLQWIKCWLLKSDVLNHASVSSLIQWNTLTVILMKYFISLWRWIHSDETEKISM